MRIGILSDTHGHTALTRDAVRMLECLDVAAVLHCGDIGTPEIVEMFSAWPTHFVLGNCDYDHEGLKRAVEAAGQKFDGLFGDLTFGDTRIALLHSHERERFRKTIDSGQWDVVCYGHTHVAAIDDREGTLLVNPGAIYRANPHSVAVLTLPENEAQIVHL